MFAVLRQDESDEEEKPKKQTKHEQRAEDKLRREAHGDRSGKADTKGTKTQQAAKDNYGGGEKRAYDRHSGTGQNTFNKYEKKGGTGKGNWGSENVDVAEGTEAKATAPGKDEPEEPQEPVLTLDDYLKDNDMNLEYNVQEEAEGKKGDVKEKGFKQLKKQDADYVEDNKKSSNVESYAKNQTNAIQGVEGQQYGRRNTYDRNQKKPAKKALNNDDFPALG